MLEQHPPHTVQRTLLQSFRGVVPHHVHNYTHDCTQASQTTSQKVACRINHLSHARTHGAPPPPENCTPLSRLTLFTLTITHDDMTYLSAQTQLQVMERPVRYLAVHMHMVQQEASGSRRKTPAEPQPLAATMHALTLDLPHSPN